MQVQAGNKKLATVIRLLPAAGALWLKAHLASFHVQEVHGSFFYDTEAAQEIQRAESTLLNTAI